MADLLWHSAETPDLNGGGGQRRQFHQISGLVESGVRVAVATVASPQADSTIRSLAPVHRFDGRRRSWRNRSIYSQRCGLALRYTVRALVLRAIPFPGIARG